MNLFPRRLWGRSRYKYSLKAEVFRLFGEDDGVDYIVRSYRNLKLQGIPFEVFGDVWDGVLICDEFSILKNIFEEFFLIGDVSKELLN